MTTTKCIPSLSSSGYVTEPKQKLALMFSHAFRIRHNDSNLHRDYIVSIQKVIAEHQKQPDLLVSALTQELTAYFERVFERAQVTITREDIDQSIYHLTLDAVVWENGVQHSLGRVLSVDPSTTAMQLIEDINR